MGAKASQRHPVFLDSPDCAARHGKLALLSTLPWLRHLGPSALAGAGGGKAVYLTAQLRPKFRPRQVHLTFLYIISEKSTQRKQLTNGIIKNVTI